jgi:hypothetical protein
MYIYRERGRARGVGGKCTVREKEKHRGRRRSGLKKNEGPLGCFSASAQEEQRASDERKKKKLGKMNDSFFTVSPAPLLSVSPSCQSTTGGKTTSLVAGGE